MRITGNPDVEFATTKVVANTQPTTSKIVMQGSKLVEEAPVVESNQSLDNSEETKVKVQEAVSKLNEMLDVNNSTSKFMYHDGLERYYVTVVDRQTEEIVKEIPPRKLLDAFYEMQKMLGMIVDEKI